MVNSALKYRIVSAFNDTLAFYSTNLLKKVEQLGKKYSTKYLKASKSYLNRMDGQIRVFCWGGRCRVVLLTFTSTFSLKCVLIHKHCWCYDGPVSSLKGENPVRYVWDLVIFHSRCMGTFNPHKHLCIALPLLWDYLVKFSLPIKTKIDLLVRKISPRALH